MNSIKAAAAYFAYVFGAGFVLGAIRVPFLVPRVGVRTAELIEMPFMALVIWFAAHGVVSRFAVAPKASVRLVVGFVALVFVLAAELLLSILVQGQSLTEYIASRDPVSGTVYVAMLLVFALLPTFIRP